jgi:hypothetical protein
MLSQNRLSALSYGKSSVRMWVRSLERCRCRRIVSPHSLRLSASTQRERTGYRYEDCSSASSFECSMASRRSSHSERCSHDGAVAYSPVQGADPSGLGALDLRSVANMMHFLRFPRRRRRLPSRSPTPFRSKMHYGVNQE